MSGREAYNPDPPTPHRNATVPQATPRTIEGDLSARELRVACVAARFNEFVVEPLLRGALDALARHGIDESRVDVVRVPGAFEIPLVVRKLAASARYDALIALGAVIRGDTPHAEYISAEVAKGIAHVYLETGVPVAFGVITSDTLEQALERAGAKSGNKGWTAALSAIEMADLEKQKLA